MKKISSVRAINIKTFTDKGSNLSPIEFNNTLPFKVKRLFYVHGTQANDIRGSHSHKKTEQILICVAGKIKVTCKDGKDERSFLLESPSQALYIPEMIWDEQEYLTNNAVLLVLANTKYDKNDYIEDWQQFVKENNVV